MNLRSVDISSTKFLLRLTLLYILDVCKFVFEVVDSTKNIPSTKEIVKSVTHMTVGTKCRYLYILFFPFSPQRNLGGIKGVELHMTVVLSISKII